MLATRIAHQADMPCLLLRCGDFCAPGQPSLHLGPPPCYHLLRKHLHVTSSPRTSKTYKANHPRQFQINSPSSQISLLPHIFASNLRNVSRHSVRPFASRITASHAKDILARDRARAQKLLLGLHPHGPAAFREARRKRHHGHHGAGGPTGGEAEPSAGDAGVDVTDAGVTYTTSVGVGSPATQYTLLIDTGSSNTWIGADKKYVKTSTSKSTGKTVNVSYGSGSFSGTEYTDTVTLAPGLVIESQSIGVASSAQGFSGVDGILGIGPVDLTQGTVSGTESVPTVTDNLFAQGTISEDSIGIFYEPTTTEGATNGELTFGGTDSTKYTGAITSVPITSTSPASNYWGIDQDVSYGDSTSLLSGSAGIVDTGTTLLLIATDAFQAYQKATGAKEDQTTGLLTLTASQFNKLQSLFFTIGETTFELTANAQIWPRSLNSVIGGEEGKIYLVVSDLGSPSGQGLDFINGFAFLQRFYSVFDTGNTQVGLATTPFTDATTN
ncbi:Polyporopepsin [Grifola frondosa]|uniref:Polyporopepsin n=1 Tax=Grifola frondosa TaxID=5627 RepID=A0A1C7M477_GRIFR|nr:Polyporopepsin [Grifola frondosa]